MPSAQAVSRVEAEARAALANKSSIAAFVKHYAPVFGHSQYRDGQVLPNVRALLLLSNTERNELLRHKLKVARADPLLCAGFWNGEAAKGNLVGAFERHLSPADFEDWIRLDAKASLLALDSGPAVALPAGDDLMAALRAVDASLSPDDSNAFRSAVQARELAPPADGCKAYLVLVEAAGRIAGPPGELLTRFALSPELVGAP